MIFNIKSHIKLNSENINAADQMNDPRLKLQYKTNIHIVTKLNNSTLLELQLIIIPYPNIE